MALQATVGSCVEWGLESGRDYESPLREIVLDALVKAPSGRMLRIPAYWAGGRQWRFRFTPFEEGNHEVVTECSVRGDLLHGQSASIEARHRATDLLPLQQGPLKVSGDKRHFELADGTPFLWLADTWWFGLCQRLHWPQEFQELAADRVRKGFSVVQIIAGLYPDVPPFDPRGENEAGLPWKEDWSTINPAYWDQADLRLRWIVQQGLLPCIVGSWGYFLSFTDVETMKLHWRNLIARYAAWPVVWCTAGEALMPFYVGREEDTEEKIEARREGWRQIAEYIRATDPYGRLVTVHPGGADTGRDILPPAVLDFNMLQTGHGDRGSIPNTLNHMQRAFEADPPLPFVNSEVCYEGIGEACREEMQRYYFWATMLSGGAGHTYGANGLWQLNRREQLFGPSPHGSSWGDRPWDEAMRLPGSTHVGASKRWLETLAWWQLEPHPEWLEAPATEENPGGAYAAGIPGQLRVIYNPQAFSLPSLKHLEPNVTYDAALVDPRNGKETPFATIVGDAEGKWRYDGFPPVFQDWIIVLRARHGDS